VRVLTMATPVTRSMLTGQLEPSSGTAFVGGFDVVRQRRLAQRHMGVCQQFDILLPDSSGMWLCDALSTFEIRNPLRSIRDDPAVRAIARLRSPRRAELCCGVAKASRTRVAGVL
jgi:ABC-type multidrug transport system ATPase subunit